MRLTPDRLKALGDQLQAVIERFRSEQAPSEDGRALPISVVLHTFPRLDLDPASGRWEG